MFNVMTALRSRLNVFQDLWKKILKPRPKKRLIQTMIACCLAIVLWPAPVVNNLDRTALNGTWMTHVGVSLMYYSTRLDDTIADLARHKINTLYPAVWNHGHTLFSSQVVKKAGGSDRNPWVNLPLPWSDPMAGLVTQTQRQHLRLIPWFEYGLMIPSDAEIIKRHPTWLTQAQDSRGKSNRTLFPNPIQSLRQSVLGRDQSWLNPFHPDVQQFLTDLMVEVVTKYSVDGIQLDDHFALPIEYGYDPYTIALYQADHQGQSPPYDPHHPEWMKWRADRITQLMARMSKAVKAVRQDAIVSLSPNAADYAYRRSLQDWPRWVELGLLDEVIVQLYRPDLTSLQSELDRAELKAMIQKVSLAIGLYTGPFKQAKSASQIKQEVQAVRSAGYTGISFFSWETTFGLFRGK